MAVRDWLGGFLERHRARFSPHDWPAPAAEEESREFMLGWLSMLSRNGVTEQEADVASCRLMETPPNFRREHAPMVLEAVKQLRAERHQGNDASASSTRDVAKLASRECPHCGGEGLATAFHPWPNPEDRVAPTAAAYCVCAHGRWIKKNHAERCPEYIPRIVDLDYVVNRASIYVLNEDPEFDKAALCNWGTLPEMDRQVWIQMARDRIPCWRGGSVEKLAIAWAQDPSWVIGLPEPADARSNAELGPRRLFEHIEQKVGIGHALQYLVGMLAVKPTPLYKILDGATHFAISHKAIFAAANALEVIKTTVDGEETWDVQQGRVM
jgi:hypothetical protein